MSTHHHRRALGPRRSHAFLDRLPLVETEDVDRTFAWFERHGRSAVFFGRMVPIVRSFISVPAGVVTRTSPARNFAIAARAREVLGWRAREQPAPLPMP